MWGKVPFKARKSSGGDHRPTTTRTFQPSPSPSPPVAHSRDLSAKALPTVPAGTPSQFTSQSNPRVPSSVYSRDTVVFDHHRERTISDAYQFPPQLDVPISSNGHSSETRSVDISPPDSPISRTHTPNSGRVSPINDYPAYATNASTKYGGYQQPSHIPVLQKRVESPTQPVKPPPRANTRWDVYSGEPTTSGQGRAGQVNPSKVSFETHASGPRQRSNSSKILDWGKEQLHSRKKPSESRNRFYYEDSPFAPREPWKGQSGRAAIVQPIEEKPRNRSSSRLRMSRSFDRLREMNTPSPVVGGSSTGSTTFTTMITAGEKNHRQQPKQNVYDVPKTEVTSRNASAVSISGTAPPRVDLVSSPDLSASLTDLTLSDDDAHHEPEPTSRFSVTTYNPTEVGSPNHSPRPSITPSPPASIIETASQSSDTARSIMSRARPVPSAIAPGKRPLRKPTPSEVPSTKELPPNPVHMTAQERIQMLEGKRTALVRRRTNINTIINELTQVIQPSSIAYDMAAREEVKKTVASLNNELAEIKKEEHDIGLKLLRLWKKVEDEEFFGGSGTLWVKRVTS